ncbi:hypothetical protein BC830DRAFT_175568, partial [Chytriomyces sp. MP71]
MALNVKDRVLCTLRMHQILSQPRGVGDSCRALLVVLKQLLASRGLRSGKPGECGVDSHVLFHLVYFFVKSHPTLAVRPLDPTRELGDMLLDFLKIFALDFDAGKHALHWRNGRLVCAPNHACKSAGVMIHDMMPGVSPIRARASFLRTQQVFLEA